MLDQTMQYEMNVLIKGKKPSYETSSVFEYNHTDGNTYIEGRIGSEYLIEFKNNSFEKVMIVPSVDGLSALNGTTNWDDGYIVDPQTSIQIPGWRIDNNKIASFEFSDIRNSYRTKMGYSSNNVGVIGIMVFREKPKISSLRRVDTVFASSAGTVSGQSYMNSAGTGWGKEEIFKTVEEEFEKRDPKNPDALLALYYDTAKGLEKRGIQIKHRYQPDPFPGFPNNYFNTVGCPPPKTKR